MTQGEASQALAEASAVFEKQEAALKARGSKDGRGVASLKDVVLAQ